MADFLKAVEALLKKEGAFVDDADDRGGATKFGISARRFPEIDLAALTRAQAIELYRVNFWHPLYEKLDDQAVANKLLELTVHLPHDAARPFYQGRMKGIELAQRACRMLGDREIAIDSRFGPQTLQALRLERPQAWLAAVTVAQCRHYLSLADEQESQRKFFRGWIRRAVAALAAVSLLAAFSGAPARAQQDTLERMEEDFFKLSEPCNAEPAEERRLGGEDFRIRIYRCGHRLWRLWSYRCPEGYWSRVFLLDQADDREDSYYLDRFAGLHNGRPAILTEPYRPPCRA